MSRSASPPPPGTFVVTGTVRAQGSGQPLGGLAVRAYDEDRRKDDYLGRDTTDAAGHYEIRFTAAAFRRLFELRPDVYVRVYDAGGRELAATKDQVRKNASKHVTIDVEIPEGVLGGA